jgi:hypothetical protein
MLNFHPITTTKKSLNIQRNPKRLLKESIIYNSILLSSFSWHEILIRALLANKQPPKVRQMGIIFNNNGDNITCNSQVGSIIFVVNNHAGGETKRYCPRVRSGLRAKEYPLFRGRAPKAKFFPVPITE